MKQLYELKGRSFNPGDSQRPGGIQKLCAQIPAVSPGSSSQRTNPQGIQAGPLQGVPTRAAGGGVWRTVWCCFGNCGGGATPAAILYSKSTCIPFGDRICPRPPGGLRPSRENRLKSMGQLHLFHQRGQEETGFGLRHGPKLVPGHLRGTGTPSRRGRLPPVPRQRLCSPGRGTPPLPLRQCQGWWCWVGRRTADPGGTPGSWTLP